jgi:predicted DNA-binding transcriptional regulator AlpA
MTTAPASRLEGDLDGYLDTRDVERLTGYTRRWISQLIKRGKFPPPDVHGGRGAAHRWRCSTILRALDDMQKHGAKVPLPPSKVPLSPSTASVASAKSSHRARASRAA